MKQTLTKDEWAQVEERLIRHYTPVGLMCDGYHLTLKIMRYGMKLLIVPYINGILKGEWLTAESEERRRFFRPVKKSVWSAKALSRMKKMNKRQLKECGIDPGESITAYYPYWTSFKALKSHLQKNNESIELLKDWQYEEKK